MILEGVVTTLNEDNSINVAPMGPEVEDDSLIFKPFSSSTTYSNLKRHPRGVFHVTDDVLLIAQAAIGHVEPELETIPSFDVARLKDTYRWTAFTVAEADWGERARLRTTTVESGQVRDFFGLNRAKHAVLEATILATRVHMLDHDDILQQLELLRPLVEKTAGPNEQEAFAVIEDYITHSRSSRSVAESSDTNAPGA